MLGVKSLQKEEKWKIDLLLMVKCVCVWENLSVSLVCQKRLVCRFRAMLGGMLPM